MSFQVFLYDADVIYIGIRCSLNIYDTRPIRCSKCGKFMGEIEYDAVVTLPKCGQCANPLPEGDDKVGYILSKYDKNLKSIVVQ